MAVYTEVAEPEAAALLLRLGLGQLTALRACPDGIENTNYFVDAELHGATQRYVLTLFERLTAGQLPFYLQLMRRLAQRGILVPTPHANAQGELVLNVHGKPAAVVDRLPGRSELTPGQSHCTQVGAMLARMHLAGRDFELHQPNLRGLSWWNDTTPVVLPHLSAAQQSLLQQELAYQNQLASSADYAALPRGPIHADLFRDNVMFDTIDGQPHLSGFFDFYFAGVDIWLFDLAVCLNDWCIEPVSSTPQPALAQALIAAYQAVRPLTPCERRLLPDLLRAAALRFWLSRLWDFYLPRAASVLQPRDPSHCERVLRTRATQVLPFEAMVNPS
ncbi:MAG: homoserine kinase [Rhodoferax sp.]|nr:homoserine kinase [Rhodoferax sp.]